MGGPNEIQGTGSSSSSAGSDKQELTMKQKQEMLKAVFTKQGAPQNTAEAGKNPGSNASSEASRNKPSEAPETPVNKRKKTFKEKVKSAFSRKKKLDISQPSGFRHAGGITKSKAGKHAAHGGEKGSIAAVSKGELGAMEKTLQQQEQTKAQKPKRPQVMPGKGDAAHLRRGIDAHIHAQDVQRGDANSKTKAFNKDVKQLKEDIKNYGTAKHEVYQASGGKKEAEVNLEVLETAISSGDTKTTKALLDALKAKNVPIGVAQMEDIAGAATEHSKGMREVVSDFAKGLKPNDEGLLIH